MLGGKDIFSHDRLHLKLLTPVCGPQLPRGLDATAWIKLCSLFKCYGVAVKVKQVFSVDQV